MWQDITITAVTITFGYALLPQIYKGFKDKAQKITIQTTLITSLGLYVMAFCFYTLGLHYTSMGNLLIGILWTIILIQSIKYIGGDSE